MPRLFWSISIVILLVAAFFIPVAAAPSGQERPDPPVGVPLPPETVQVIDDFESGDRGWQAFYDTSTDSSISCLIEEKSGENGSRALRIEFSLAPNGWANCSLLFAEAQDWSAAEWLAYDLHAEETGLVFNEILYGGAPDRPEMYTHQTEIFTQYEGYIGYFTFWKDFLRVKWEDNPNTPFQTPERVLGVGFGVETSSNSYSGVFWIDNLRTAKSPSYDKPGGDAPRLRLPCAGSALAPLALAVMLRSARRMARRK